jgi:hypothetical protein
MLGREFPMEPNIFLDWVDSLEGLRIPAEFIIPVL